MPKLESALSATTCDCYNVNMRCLPVASPCLLVATPRPRSDHERELGASEDSIESRVSNNDIQTISLLTASPRRASREVFDVGLSVPPFVCHQHVPSVSESVSGLRRRKCRKRAEQQCNAESFSNKSRHWSA